MMGQRKKRESKNEFLSGAADLGADAVELGLSTILTPSPEASDSSVLSDVAEAAGAAAEAAVDVLGGAAEVAGDVLGGAADVASGLVDVAGSALEGAGEVLGSIGDGLG